jgi:hypothetical protein
VGRFIDIFVDEQLISEYILYWNSVKSKFRPKMRRINQEELKELIIRNSDNLYIYLERYNELFKGNIRIILDFFDQREPWEDSDITVFDGSYNWFIAFTHEDEIIYTKV